MMLKQKKIAIAFVGIASILISWPCFIFYGPKPVIKSDNTNIIGHRCTSIRGPWTATEPLVFKTFILMLIVICLIILIVAYGLIGRVVRRQIRFRKRSKSNPNVTLTDEEESGPRIQETREENTEELSTQDSESGTIVFSTEASKNFDKIKKAKIENKKTKKVQKESGIRFTKVFMLITLIFVLSYIPKLGMMVYESRKENFWTDLSHHELGGYRFLYTLFIINNIVNPFIYGYFDTQFRAEFTKIFCKCNRQQ